MRKLIDMFWWFVKRVGASAGGFFVYSEKLWFVLAALGRRCAGRLMSSDEF